VRYVARQAILDLHGKVHAYELLFRDGSEAAFRGDGNQASRIMVDNTLLFGLGKLTCGLPAFVNCTAETLTGDWVRLLPAGMTVLEVLEDIEFTPEVVQACRRLKTLGFRLALDDFVWRAGVEPLVKLADYIKVDFVATSYFERRALLERLHDTAVALVAEKVETEEEYREARELGFTLVQGYYFCRPVLLENRKVPANRMTQIEILSKLQDESVDMHELAEMVKRDTSLTYRLLRLVNSPVCAIQQEVRSVETALVAVGHESFRRLATLAIASELNEGRPLELLRMAFVRARFCELAAESYQLDGTEQYLLGLLSLLPAMLRLPMSDLVASLPLRKEILTALQEETGTACCLLRWLKGHERGDWATCDALVSSYALKRGELLRCYAEAAIWAEAVLRLT
jgi:EAL and modified HD-GYP domain-containing signal transduction protein